MPGKGLYVLVVAPYLAFLGLRNIVNGVIELRRRRAVARAGTVDGTPDDPPSRSIGLGLFELAFTAGAVYLVLLWGVLT